VERFVVASLSTILCVLVSALAAYALTRLRNAAPQPDHVGAARGGDVPADLPDVPLFKVMRSSGCSTPTSR